MNGISKWLQVNKLSLHLGKTESILLGFVPGVLYKKVFKQVSKLKISCNNVEIAIKSSVQFLVGCYCKMPN